MESKKLFEPICIRNLEIKNRIIMAPINLNNLYSPNNGTIPQRVIDFYVERAKEGVGLIITGVFKVENKIENYQKNGVRLWQEVTLEALPGFSELADYIHNFGGKIFIQLSAGPGRQARGDVIDAGFIPVSSSPNPAYYRPSIICRELTTEEVDEIVEAFGRTAQMVRTTGIDGVEIHGHEGYLIDQFNTSLWNKRNDKYGGDLLGRLKFATKILEAIKKMAGEDFPVIFRYGIKHFIREPWKSSLRSTGFVEMGRDIDESIEVAEILEKAGYDALHINAGCYDAHYWSKPPIYQPDACLINLMNRVKNVVKIPIIVVGKLGDPIIAEEILQQNKADMIALGRPLLADEQWPSKVREGMEEDIRPCIGCHEGCFRLATIQNKPMSCSVNPSCCKEKIYPPTKSHNLKKILIIGGGVAGMEAARIAAQKGHHIVLFEKNGHLGGHLREACVPEFKRDLKKLLNWYERQMVKLKIEIHMNSEITQQSLFNHLDFDVAVLATGSAPYSPSIPGIQKTLVTNCCEVLSGKKRVGAKVIILGGGLEGCETAVWLGKMGKSVRIVEMLENLATSIHSVNREMLLDMINDTHIEVLTESSIAEVFDDGIVVVDRSLNKTFIKCDNLILGVGLEPIRNLYGILRTKFRVFYEIGDCKTPRNLHYAILEGFNIGYFV